MNRFFPVAALMILTVLAGSAWAATPHYSAWHVANRYAIGGNGGWDYLAFDNVAQRLYISRSDRVLVLNARNGRKVGQIDGLSRVHGIALADRLHRGFISDGRADTVTVFDPATLKKLQTIPVEAHDPDAIVYDPYSQRVLAFNGHSDDASVIDAVNGKLLGTIPLPGHPEFAVSDARGHIYDNIEDKSELVRINPRTLKVTATWHLRDCKEPSGLAIDITHRRLFSVCQNGNMAVTDADTGNPVASVPIGSGPDAAGFDPRRGLVFSANGRSGTLTVVREINANHYAVVANVPTQVSARTMTLNESTGSVYLSAAKLGPRPAPTTQHPHPWPSVMPGSFAIIKVSRKH